MSQDAATRSTPRGALNNAGWNAIATVWNITISFLLTPLLIYYLGTEQYGLLLLVWSVTGLLAITNLGVGEATLRYVSHYLGDRDMRGVNRVFGSTLAFYALVCTAVSAVLIPATPFVVGLINMPQEAHAEAGWLLRVAALLFSVGMISNAFKSIPMALHRYDITSRVGLVQGSVRTIGFAGVVLLGYGALHVILWDVATAVGVLVVQVAIARKLLPGLGIWPRLSAAGVREIFGYSVYSFLTHVFLSASRESGKLILGNQFGPSAVAFLGTPDSIAYRIYMVVVSGVETLMPRFSATRDGAAARALVVNGTQTALTIAAIFFVPLAVLMPDLIRLWIDAEFARESALAGRVLALSFIAPAGFAVIATYYRGTGRPGFVTAVLAGVGVVVVVASLLLAPAYGPAGVACAYLLSSVPWFGGLAWGWFKLFDERSLGQLMRSAGVPVLIAGIAFVIQVQVKSVIGEVNWPGLLVLGGLFAASTFAFVMLTEYLLGGPAPARELVDRFAMSRRVVAARRRIQLWQAR
jgi:O-antigen/teichoic acid export membrane protein